MLHAFSGGHDGAYPSAGLIRDEAGNLYGTTSAGGGSGCETQGNEGCGTIFRLSPDCAETVLFAFRQHRRDGRVPEAGLMKGRRGLLYGTASEGGSTGCHAGAGCGTVFSLDR